MLPPCGGAVTHHRKNARIRSCDSIDKTPDDEASDLTLRNLLPDNRLDPATVSAIKQLVQKASGKVSVRDMQIILYKAEGYKEREIAEMPGMTTGGVAVTYMSPT